MSKSGAGMRPLLPLLVVLCHATLLVDAATVFWSTSSSSGSLLWSDASNWKDGR